jgi:hypothetical protein
LIPQFCCDFMPCPEGLHVRGIVLAHRAVNAKLPTMLVQPFPNCVAGIGAIAPGKIGGTAVAKSPSRSAPSVERIAAVRLEAGSKTLSVVVTKCA